jgi:putative membrane protein insertion efficiency factor
MPNKQLIKRNLEKTIRNILTYPIKFYQFFLSPWVGQHCRFYPTCSHYALEAIQTHGSTLGTWLTLKRLARCHPWCEGGIDPVPNTQANIR